jgi:hypothetical protein
MVVFRRFRIARGLLVLGLGFGISATPARAQAPDRSQDPSPASAGAQEPVPPPPQPPAPPPLVGPRTGVEAPPATRGPAPRLDPIPGASPEVQREEPTTPTAPRERVSVTTEPPPPIAERPSGERPGPKAVWTSGYWEWDPDEARFVWVAGSWRIPPAGMTWVAGRWTHDARGWYWVPGTWGRPASRVAVAADRPAWRISGPPAEQPEDVPPPAPGPDFFYVPGHYAPATDGDRLSWVPGFWSATQPGWDWIPARWVRRPDGWDFREGYWVRDPAAAVVERVPLRDLRRARRNVDVSVIARDPITGAEVDVAAVGEPVPVGVVTGMPYYVIRPPGYPYGPNGVVVPGAVPPFVRRMLNRVLP